MISVRPLITYLQVNVKCGLRDRGPGPEVLILHAFKKTEGRRPNTRCQWLIGLGCDPVRYRNLRLPCESCPIDVQPISFMSLSISARSKPSARSTPGWPAAASGKR